VRNLTGTLSQTANACLVADGWSFPPAAGGADAAGGPPPRR